MRLDPRLRLAFLVVLLIPADRRKSLLIDSKSFPAASRCFSLLSAAFPLLLAAFKPKECKLMRLDPRPRLASLVVLSIPADRCKSLLIDSYK